MTPSEQAVTPLGAARLRRRRRPAAPVPAPGDAERATALLCRFGENPVSFVVRYPGPWRYFFSESGDAVACYLEACGTAVVWGDPLCAPERSAEFLRELTSGIRRVARRVCLVHAGERTAGLAAASGYGVLKIGENASFDLTSWSRPTGRSGKTLRGKLNRARREGLVIGELEPASPAAELADVHASWARPRARELPSSILEPMPLLHPESKRIFVARRGGRAVAFLTCAPVYARDGWLLEDLIRRPDAPAGATEALVLEALCRLTAEGASYATLGLAPLRRPRQQPDWRFRVASPLLHRALGRFDRRYGFHATAAFQSKFAPTHWESSYVAFRPYWPTPGLMRGVLSALDL